MHNKKSGSAAIYTPRHINNNGPSSESLFESLLLKSKLIKTEDLQQKTRQLSLTHVVRPNKDTNPDPFGSFCHVLREQLHNFVLPALVGYIRRSLPAEIARPHIRTIVQQEPDNLCTSYSPNL